MKLNIDEKEKYQKILFSIRMLKLHSYITELEYSRLLKKFEKRIVKEQEATLEEADKLIEELWYMS